MSTFYIFEPLKAHTYEPNISLIRLFLIMQNPIETLNTSCDHISSSSCWIKIIVSETDPRKHIL